MTAIEFLEKEFPLSIDSGNAYYINSIIYFAEKYHQAKLSEIDNTTCPVCQSEKTYGTIAIHCNNCAVTTEV